MAVFKHTVHISDPENPDEILEWARTLKGFVHVIETDVTDVSYTADTIFSYTFTTQEEASWFRLRWE
jgi:hypothetical protein